MISKSKPYLFLFVAGMLLWACMTRPLICHFGSAIPYNERRNPETSAVSEIVPGDHIQLLYHFWLCRDMIAGKTPAFSNVYEFNTGDDGARRQFDPYYIPFSIVYALVSPLFGHAAGWNAAGLFAVLVGLFGFFALSRRYAGSDAVAIIVAVVAAAFPYRWITLLGGSPTGFASCLVPWLLFGLDKAVRDKSPSGGLVAGAALFFSYCSDLHVFYFSALLTPCWCLFAWLADDRPVIPDRKRIVAVFRALLPAIALAAAALAISSAASGSLAKSPMAGGRDIRELRIFSPILSGLFRWQHLGASNHIFAGAGLAVLLGFGYIAFALGFRRDNSPGKWRPWLLTGLLTVAVVVIVLLALGTYGPWNALPIRAARKIIPKYRMIRQPMKIFCILPPILCVLLSLLYRRIIKGGAFLKFAAIPLAVATVCEQALWLRPAICELPDSLPAYAKAAEFARANGHEKPHAVCLPLWPGDSHFSSIYEYGALSSRIRLVNGYAPAVPEDYYEKVFSKLSSLNNGVMDEEQRQLLLSIGVNLVIFHEQPYPSKVSPFPAGTALDLLRGNPALKEVAAGDGVFAFAMTGETAELNFGHDKDGMDFDFPAAYQWSMSRLTDRGREPGHAKAYRPRLRAPVPILPDMCYKLLLSGGGRLMGDCGHEVAVPDKPTWVSVPFTDPLGENFRVVEGDPVAHHALIAAGEGIFSSPAEIGEIGDYFRAKWRAAQLFHLGYSTEDGQVTFDAKRNHAGMLLYGPDLPFPAGNYTATITGRFAQGNAFVASTIGDGGKRLAITKLKADDGNGPSTATISFRHDGLLPLRLEYHFSGKGEACVESLSLTKGKMTARENSSLTSATESPVRQ